MWPIEDDVRWKSKVCVLNITLALICVMHASSVGVAKDLQEYVFKCALVAHIYCMHKAA